MTIKKGDTIIFKGYDEAPPDGGDLLTPDAKYEVVEVDDTEGSVAVAIPNPDFNPKKKESDSNQPTILVDIFMEELELFVPTAKAPAKTAAKAAAKTPAKAPAQAADTAEDDADGDGDGEGEGDGDGDGAEAEADAPKTAAKTSSKAAAKAAAKPAAKAPAKSAAKTPAKAPAKASTKAPAKAAPKPAAPQDSDHEDPYADLDEANEDQEILGLVNDAEDILELARETVEEASALEYKLGGVLFHVRKSEAYKEMDERYAEKGGFSLYLLECLNIEYRKAMYLIDIYYKWNKYGLDADKVAQIGWAKASKIAAVMTEDTAEELLALAEGNTVADLVDHIKTSYKEVGGTRGDKKVVKLFKFRLLEASAVAVEEVLQSVAASMGFKTLDDAFEHVIMEWSTEHPIEVPENKVGGRAATKQVNGKSRAKA